MRGLHRPQTLNSMKIISGGQTGADRAALDFAIAADIEHGGWCPRGRKAEDGYIDLKYKLRETPSEGYRQRNEWNVRDSDATVIFTFGPYTSSPGSLLTSKFCKAQKKPWISFDIADPGDVMRCAFELGSFVTKNKVRVLNVAGNRESRSPGIYERVKKVLGMTASLTWRENG